MERPSALDRDGVIRSELSLWFGAAAAALFAVYGDAWLMNLSDPLSYGFLFFWLFAFMLWLAFGDAAHRAPVQFEALPAIFFQSVYKHRGTPNMANNRASVEKRSEAYVFRNSLTRAIVAAAIAGVLFMVVHLSERVSGIEHQLASGAQIASFRPIAAMKHLIADAEAAPQVAGHLIYLPIYSHIYAEGGQSFPLETTVSIRNTDPVQSMTLISARYFDTKGSMLQEYLDATKEIAPLETVEFLIKIKRHQRWHRRQHVGYLAG